MDTTSTTGFPNERLSANDVSDDQSGQEIRSRLDVETAGVSFMRCHQWLEEAYESTTDQGIRRLIEDVMDDLWALGSVEGELGDLVIGALESVAVAMEVESLLVELG